MILNRETTTCLCDIITAELGRALAVVKVTLQVNGNSQFLGVRNLKTFWGDKDKIWHK